jgi:HEAT repeat protein
VWISTIADLIHRSEDEYRLALPILIRWLPIATYVSLREDIVRTLSMPAAKGIAGPALVAEFKRAQDDGLRWAAGNALSRVADERLFDELASLIQDPRYGRAREMLAMALAETRNPRAVPILIRLLNQGDLVGHVAMALGTLRAEDARESLAAVGSNHPAWVRREVEKALAAINGEPLGGYAR